MTPTEIADWMLRKLTEEDSLYQEDVIDFLVKHNETTLLQENADGNEVLSKAVLSAFKKITEHNVVWIRSERYWRFRTKEDSAGRMGK